MKDQYEFSSEAEQALSSMMGALRGGNNVDITTRIVQVDKHGDYLRKALGRANTAQDVWDWTALGELPEGPLRRREFKEREGWGTMSRRPGCFTDSVRDDSLHKQLLRYFTPRARCKFNTEAMDYADRFVSSLYPVHRLGRLRPLCLEEAAVRFHRTGLGFPIVSSNSERYHEQVLALSQQIWDSGGDLDWIAVNFALAGFRGQPLGPPDEVSNPGGFSKTRLIYMMPRVLANLEKCIQAPLLDALKDRSSFPAWKDAENVDREMTRLLSTGRRVLSIDFSKFDQTVPFEVLSRVYNIFRSWYVPEAGPLIDFAEEVMKRTGIIFPDKDGTKGDYEVFSGSSRTGGICSGSVMTNMSGSNVNAWVMAYAAKKCKTEILLGCFNGDDGAIVFKGDPSMDDLAYELRNDLSGMTLSTKKSTMEPGAVTFLQNVHEIGRTYKGLNVGIRSIMHACNPMTSHETADKLDWVADDYETIRFCQQAGYCLHHPSATQLGDWLAERDVYAKDVLRRVKVDPDFYLKACEAVRKKDSNSQKGFSPQALWASPMFQYMLSKV